MAEGPADDASLWAVELQKVVRIEPQDFEAEAPNLSASVEAMVCDVADEIYLAHLAPEAAARVR